MLGNPERKWLVRKPLFDWIANISTPFTMRFKDSKWIVSGAILSIAYLYGRNMFWVDGNLAWESIQHENKQIDKLAEGITYGLAKRVTVSEDVTKLVTQQINEINQKYNVKTPYDVERFPLETKLKYYDEVYDAKRKAKREIKLLEGEHTKHDVCRTICKESFEDFQDDCRLYCTEFYDEFVNAAMIQAPKPLKLTHSDYKKMKREHLPERVKFKRADQEKIQQVREHKIAVAEQLERALNNELKRDKTKGH